MKNVVNKISLILLILAALMLTACGNLFSSGSEKSIEPSATGETYISIKFNNHPRTISSTAPFTKNEFTNIELMGAPYYSGEEMKRLAYAETMPTEGLTAKITDGKWALTLYASYNGIVFSDNKVVDLLAKTNNIVQFNLKSTEHFGGCDITYKVPEQVAKAKITIKKASNESLVWEEEILAVTAENPEDGKIVRFSKLPGQLMDDNTKLRLFESGTYLMTFKFFGGHDDYGYTLLNTNESYLVISDAKITTAEIALDFNNCYRITYDWNGGEIASETSINVYSAKSSFELPTAKYNGIEAKNFIGWRNLANGKLIKNIDRGTTGDLELQAVYAYNKIYVSNNISGEAGADVLVGDDTNNTGFTVDSPLFSIDAACQKIIDNANSEVDWTIYIIGSIATKGTELSGANQYKQSCISADVTTSHAKSILITGAREPDANGLPVDEINRKMNRSATTDGSNYGTGLVVSTSVPVTIKNLKITHGKNLSEGDGGGALRVDSGATVTLGDGVWLHDNYAENGGGVYNAGNLYIVGSAIIGDPTKSTQADGYSTVNNSSCYADQGGAIYNVGCLYLGYSNYISETENTPEEWTGGLFYNYSTSGGAIYNKKDATVVMKSGTLAFNSNGSSGSGGGAVYNLGTFKMKGGSIENNSARAKNGGGFFNAQNNTDGSGTFIFTGGTIKSNKIVYGSGGTYPNGGGVYNAGNMYVYGNAVIGDASATTAATDANHCSNFAVGFGGGIFVHSTGMLYLGYKSFTSLTENEPETWNGGIYYNYAGHNCTDTGGGGIGTDGGTIYMHSGTIANNGTVYKDTAAGFNYDGKGAAVYQSGNFYISGSASIPAGEDGKQDIYINNYTDTKIVSVSGKLADTFSATITPYYYESGSTQKPALSIASGADTDYDTERGKFTITPQVDTAANMTTYWMIDSTGKLARRSGAFPFQITFEKPSFSTVGLYTKYRAESDLYDSNDNFDATRVTGGSSIPSSGVPIGNYVGIFTTNNLYSNFEWHIDGKSVSEVAGASTAVYNSHDDALLIINTTGWTPGYHDITLDVLDTVGHYVSVVYQLKLTAN